MNKTLIAILAIIISSHAAADKMLPELKGMSIQKVINVWGYPIYSTDYIDLPGPRKVYTYRHRYSAGDWGCITSIAFENSRGILAARQVGMNCPKKLPAFK